MNPFQRARDEAWAQRDKLAPGKASQPIKARDLIGAVEPVLEISVIPVDANHHDLGGGSAVLLRKSDLIYVSKAFDQWGERYCGLAAHELGHYFLDPVKSEKTIAHLKTLESSDGSPATLKVEAYGTRERQELQANVFARELLLPRRVAKQLILAGKGPKQVADDLGLPLEFARQQMLDAALLPEIEYQADQLKPPSPDQEKAARAPERFVNVVAGPGTGKTSTLVHRVKHLIEVTGIPPGQILALTFTNKAAFELVDRLRNAGIEDAADVWAGTFHSFGLEFLRKYHQKFGLGADLNVSDKVTDVSALIKALSQVKLEYFNRLDDPYQWLGLVHDAMSRLKEQLVTPEAYLEMVNEDTSADEALKRKRKDVAALFALNEKLLADRKTVDFVDLISKPAMAMKSDRAPYAEFADKYKYILVDEYQDVTEAMVELVRQLAHNGRSLWVVGDIRQAINHWRGASMKSLGKFSTEYLSAAGGKSIKEYPLDLNRRSSSEIVALFDEMGRQHKLQKQFPLIKLTATKGASGEKPTLVTCKDSKEIPDAVIAEITALQKAGVSYGKQSVLSRKGSEIATLADSLAAAGIPIVHIGELGQRAEVKTILCLMQLLVERSPRALYGLAGTPNLSMPVADVQTLLKLAEESPAMQRGGWIRSMPPGLSVAGKKVATELKRLIGAYTSRSNPWGFVCDLLLEHEIALPPKEDQTVKAWVQRIALWQFAYAVRNGDGDMKNARLSRYLLRQRLRQRLGETYSDRNLPTEASALDGVRILTVHSSKGLEFDAVHLAYVLANSFAQEPPSWSDSERSIQDIVPPSFIGSDDGAYAEEEAVERNNLFYVALSRARKHLRLYQHNGFYGDTKVKPLQKCPSLYTGKSFAVKAQTTTPKTTVQAFAPPQTVPFEQFDSYITCPLQYWYSHVANLRGEQDLDASLRARFAVSSALKAVASGQTGKPQDHIDKAWADQKLPTPAEDPYLRQDAIAAYKRGLALHRAATKGGATYAAPVSVVANLKIELPWGHTRTSASEAEFSVVRFSTRRHGAIQTRLKPMVNGIPGPQKNTVQLRYVMSDDCHEVKAAQPTGITSTTSYISAVQFLSGSNEPRKGGHCGRCAYMTICPNAPSAS